MTLHAGWRGQGEEKVEPVEILLADKRASCHYKQPSIRHVLAGLDSTAAVSESGPPFFYLGARYFDRA